MSTLILEDVWMEDIFEWYHQHIKESCGDGAGVIVCENHADAADWFMDWLKEKHPLSYKFMHPKDVYGTIINFHDANENYMFAIHPIEIWDKDYVFIVKKDCPSVEWYDNKDTTKILRSVK